MEKKNLVMVCLCAAIAIMAVAYAAFSTTLTVDGTINATGTFNVDYVTIGTGDCTVVKKAGQDTPSGTLTRTGNLAGTIDVRLYTPGDEVQCTIKIKNGGTLSAKLDGTHTISNGLSGTSTPIAVTATSNETVLNANDEDTLTVNVKYSHTGKDQPTTTSASIKITSKYVQNITQ